MFSACKRQLVLIHSAALLGAIGHLLLAVFLLREGADADTVHPAILLASLLALGPLAATSRLDEELSRALGEPRSSEYGWWRRTQMRLHWCPPYLLSLYLVAFAAGVYGMRLSGLDMSWTGNQPLTSRLAASFSLWASMLFFAAVPILVSASRMPGTYATQFAPSPQGRQ